MVGPKSALIFTIIKQAHLRKSAHRPDSYGKNSVTVGAIDCWNETQQQSGTENN